MSTENDEVAATIHDILEGDRFDHPSGAYSFVASWMCVVVDGTHSHYWPRIRFWPTGHTDVMAPYDLMVLEQSIADDLGVGARILPQGDNRDDAMAWMLTNHDLADEFMGLASALVHYGDPRESPLDTPLVELPGGVAMLLATTPEGR